MREKGMGAAVPDVVVFFLSFLYSSVAVFLLVSQIFAPMFDNFLPLVSVLCQIFHAISGDT